MQNICGFCEEDYTHPIFNNHCDHNYHPPCLEKYILNIIHQNLLIIQCPYQGCSATLDFSLLKSLNPQIQQNFFESTFRVYKQTNSSLIQCPTVNCPFVLEFKRCQGKLLNKKTKCQQCNKYICKCMRDYQCPNCKIIFCLSCKADHTGLTCFQYLSNKNIDLNLIEFVKFLKKSNSRKCPSCNFWVQKSSGCNHMICKCKFEFCYNCNDVYSKCKCKNIPVPIQKINFPKVPIIYRKIVIRNQKKEKKQQNQLIIKPTVFDFGVIQKNRSLTVHKI